MYSSWPIKTQETLLEWYHPTCVLHTKKATHQKRASVLLQMCAIAFRNLGLSLDLELVIFACRGFMYVNNCSTKAESWMSTKALECWGNLFSRFQKEAKSPYTLITGDIIYFALVNEQTTDWPRLKMSQNLQGYHLAPSWHGGLWPLLFLLWVGGWLWCGVKLSITWQWHISRWHRYNLCRGPKCLNKCTY